MFCLVFSSLKKVNIKTKPPDRILAGGGSCLEDDKDSLIEDLHNIDSLIDDLYNKDSRIRDQHKKDSLLDGRTILVVEIINERILLSSRQNPPPARVLSGGLHLFFLTFIHV